MAIHPHENLLRGARAQATIAEYRQEYPTRSNVERDRVRSRSPF
jgi:hypothetical protein